MITRLRSLRDPSMLLMIALLLCLLVSLVGIAIQLGVFQKPWTLRDAPIMVFIVCLCLLNYLMGREKARIAEHAREVYHFHPEIELVSGKLFREGNYRNAALDAYIRVIDEVKIKARLANLDGDGLMNNAFGCANGRIPPIKFNALATQGEMDEQTGFMYLFKGICGLRNSKAHSTRAFDDALRAQDYLSLASLLMRVLDDLIVI